MRLTCARCGCMGSIEQFSADADARRVVAIAAELGADLGPPAVRYLALFAPRKNVLTWPRARKLLEELRALISAELVQRHGRDWPVTRQMWAQALEQMTEGRDSLRLPLKSHGYLLEILAGLADKSEAQAERQREKDVRSRGGERLDAAIGKVDDGFQRMKNLLGRSAIESENKTRTKLKLPPLTAAEEEEFMQGRKQ